jgi:hypothetical protein
MFHWTARTLLLTLLMLPCVGSAQQGLQAPDRIRIGGSGGALGTLQILADAFKTIPSPSSWCPAWAVRAASRP